jgi:hypothetical protein
MHIRRWLIVIRDVAIIAAMAIATGYAYDQAIGLTNPKWFLLIELAAISAGFTLCGSLPQINRLRLRKRCWHFFRVATGLCFLRILLVLGLYAYSVRYNPSEIIRAWIRMPRSAAHATLRDFALLFTAMAIGGGLSFLVKRACAHPSPSEPTTADQPSDP